MCGIPFLPNESMNTDLALSWALAENFPSKWAVISVIGVRLSIAVAGNG